MGDVLKAPVIFGISANLSSQLGIVTMSDNFGNQTRGRMLTCAGKPPVRLSFEDWADMHEAIVPKAAVALNMSGEIPLGDLESPLQTLCHKLDAEKHHPDTKAAPQHAR